MFRLIEMSGYTGDTLELFCFSACVKKIVNDSFPGKSGRLCKFPDEA